MAQCSIDVNIVNLVFQCAWKRKILTFLYFSGKLQTSRFALKAPWRSDETQLAKEKLNKTTVPRERRWKKETLLLFETMFGWVFWVREHLRDCTSARSKEPRDGGGAAVEIDVLHHHGVIFTGSDGSD